MRTNYEYRSRFRILKGGKIALVVTALLGSMTLLSAAPTTGTVTTGNATISQTSNTTTITQTTNKASINWQSFSVAPTETVNFVQPSASSITLNRVVGVTNSLIEGTMNANGQVFLINPNGIIFSKGSSVNVGGLVATTLNISDKDFQAENYTFSGKSTNFILNMGEIHINSGGYAVLAGKTISNEGLISAILGNVQLAGASQVTLNLNGNSLIKLTIDKGVLNSLVENKGIIKADGGQVYLTTQALSTVLDGMVNNTGVIEANSIDTQNGKIVLFSQGGTTSVDGTLSAKNGFIETSADTLHVTSTANIQTASWLLDPTDLTIESTGGTDLTGGSVSATAVQNALSTADVTLQADNNINVNENITWTDPTQLTLTAGNAIFVNATINNTNATTGGVYFNAANKTNKVVFDPTTGKVTVNNVYQLQWINQALAGKYELGSNIDASATSSWNSGAGFDPIGNSSLQFVGSFDGLGHTIANLFINRPSTSNVGLFGYVGFGATQQNIGLINVNIKGSTSVGGLVGTNLGSITNSYITGNIYGASEIGGLVGYNKGTITKSYVTAKVSGNFKVGGLAGKNSGSISNSYTIGQVSGNTSGALVGWNDSGSTLTDSYWDIDIKANRVGTNMGTITNLTGVYSSTSTIDAFTQATYSNLDFTNTWYMINGQTRPFLRSEYSTAISNDHQLQLMAMNVGASYTLANDITYSGDMWSSLGFSPIASQSAQFTGNFDGHGHTISNLFINRPTIDKVGLFRYASGNKIQNLGLINVDITGRDYVGSFAGATSAPLSKVYATGSVNGHSYVGGLVGLNNCPISNSYSTVNVNGYSYVGGLVGLNYSIVSSSYASGNVNATTNYTNGIIGSNETISVDNYWDIDTTGQIYGTGGTGVHSGTGTINAFSQSTYSNFNFTNTWIIYEGHTRPLLRVFMTPLTVTAKDATKTYDGNVYSNPNGVTYSTTPNSNLLGIPSYGTDKNVGTYTITPSALYSNQQGYIISYASGILTIDPAPNRSDNQALKQTKVPVKNGTAFRTDAIVEDNHMVSAGLPRIVNRGVKLPIGLINDEEL